jgi:hypothetical protein
MVDAWRPANSMGSTTERTGRIAVEWTEPFTPAVELPHAAAQTVTPLPTASTRMGARLAALRDPPATASPQNQTSETKAEDAPKKISLNWNPSRNLQVVEQTGSRAITASDEQTAADTQLNVGAQTVIRVSAVGPNTPAAVERRASISATASSPANVDARLIARGRAGSEPRSSVQAAWTGSAAHNPLRGNHTAQRAVFESDEPAINEVQTTVADDVVLSESPANPLR